MSEKYDCTEDVKRHQESVKYWMRNLIGVLQGRAEIHDMSKLEEPEKSMFDQWTPNLQRVEFGSAEYKQALDGMGEALKHHYENNRHHPEHYENGINGMTLLDLVEMVADWQAAAQAKDVYIDLRYLAERFKIEPQLLEIIANTLREEDVWNEIEGVPVGYFTPPDKRDGHVEGFEKRE